MHKIVDFKEKYFNYDLVYTISLITTDYTVVVEEVVVVAEY